MFSRAILSAVGCLLAWFLILPIFAVGGAAALILYAVLSELGAILTGSADNSIDPTEAREIARRICLGHADSAAT